MIVYPKEIIIASLRDYFSKDSLYHYVRDEWGFAKNVETKDLPLDAGLNNNLATRIFIGETFRFDGSFYPCILVRHNSSRYVPISINREGGRVEWGIRTFEDGYGNTTFFKYPKSFVFAGAWEGSISIDVITRSSRARDELVELVAMYFTDISFNNLKNAGVVCKPLSVGSPSEQDDRNDKIFRQSITMDIRTEWRREIPVENILEVINFAVEFGNVENPDSPVASNLTIKNEISLLDAMMI
jgi:hypothetical protein